MCVRVCACVCACVCYIWYERITQGCVEVGKQFSERLSYLFVHVHVHVCVRVCVCARVCYKWYVRIT